MLWRNVWLRVAVGVWAAVLIAVCVKPILKPTSGTVYVTFANAGAEFRAGNKLYDVPAPFTDNFRYSPLVAAGFAPLSLLPLGAGGALWRALGAALFLTGLAAWVRRAAPDVPRPQFFLLALPLALQTLNNGQANTHVVGFVLWAAALASGGRWAAAAVLVAGAALFKGYPLAFGMLLVLAAPLRFGVPLLAAVAAGLALPYAVQSPEYVTAQYEYWYANLSHDDRTNYPLHAGYQDVHMLLRVVGVQVPLADYRFVQAGAGGLAAAAVAGQLRRGVGRATVVLNALALGLCWMTLFGPSTETATLILLAPVLAREVLDGAVRPRWARAVAYGGAALFAVATVVLAFPHAVHRPVIALGVQPLAAVLISVSAVSRVLAAPAAARTPAAAAPPGGFLRRILPRPVRA